MFGTSHKIKNLRLLAVIVLALLGVQCASHKNAESHRHDRNPVFEGGASWYGPGFHGRKMANGKRYDMNKMTAAHKTLPFGTRVEVTNLQNNKTVELTITDRGPYIQGRILDVSRQGAEQLGFLKSGTTRVRIRVLN